MVTNSDIAHSANVYARSVADSLKAVQSKLANGSMTPDAQKAAAAELNHHVESLGKVGADPNHMFPTAEVNLAPSAASAPGPTVGPDNDPRAATTVGAEVQSNSPAAVNGTEKLTDAPKPGEKPLTESIRAATEAPKPAEGPKPDAPKPADKK